MKVKIGVAEADRVVELETEDPAGVQKMVEEAFAKGVAILWFEDVKQRLVGIPRDKVAYVELELTADIRPVGFRAASSGS